MIDPPGTCSLAVLTLLLASLAQSPESVAHDLWMVPTPWRVGPGLPNHLDLVSGMKFPAPDLEEHAYTAEDVARSSASPSVGPEGEGSDCGTGPRKKGSCLGRAVR